jgi:acetyltransferase-like isoleucine patch superfamily enzyme
MIQSTIADFVQRYRFEQLGLDRWRAETGISSTGELHDLRRRERLFLVWRTLKGFARFPATSVRLITGLVSFVGDYDRLHGAPRKSMEMGRGCVVDRQTWLVNGSNIALGDFVKVSAFSSLIAGFEAKIYIGSYTICGPGVVIVAANHGNAVTDIPIRYQPWVEKSIFIGENVWVGSNAVILPGTSIGCGSIVGAGTVVTGDIPERAVVYRDKNGSLVIRSRTK